MTEEEAEGLASEICPKNNGQLHCLHYQEGDGNCCICGKINWCPDEGVLS